MALAVRQHGVVSRGRLVQLGLSDDAITPVRTLLDLAAVVSTRQLERALAEVAYLRLDLTGLRRSACSPLAALWARRAAGQHQDRGLHGRFRLAKAASDRRDGR